MPVTVEELNSVDSLFGEFQRQGITAKSLVSELKAELRAQKTTYQKVKGAVSDDRLPQTPKGRVRKGAPRIIATSGTLSYDSEGATVFGDGDTLLAIDQIDWQTRQRARQDAHRLRGDYPPEKLLHGLTGKDGEVIDHIPIVLVGSPDVPINSEVQALMDGTDK